MVVIAKFRRESQVSPLPTLRLSCLLWSAFLHYAAVSTISGLTKYEEIRVFDVGLKTTLETVSTKDAKTVVIHFLTRPRAIAVSHDEAAKCRIGHLVEPQYIWSIAEVNSLSGCS